MRTGQADRPHAEDGPVEAASRARRNALILGSVFLFPVLFLSALFLFLHDSGIKRAVADPAIYEAQSSGAVVADIGSPVQPGWPIRGTIKDDKISGRADLQISLNGSHGKGLLIESAQKVQGKWRICSLQFESASGTTLTLMDPATSTCTSR